VTLAAVRTKLMAMKSMPSPMPKTMEYYRINPLAEQSGEGMDFSRAIRKGRK
jgi:hypothetical protein